MYTKICPHCRYFQALAKGEVPPVKTRLEQPLESADERLGGITKGNLAVLNKQVGRDERGDVVSTHVLPSYCRLEAKRQLELKNFVISGPA